MKKRADLIIGGDVIVEEEGRKVFQYPVFKRETPCNRFGTKAHVRLHNKNGPVLCYDAGAIVELAS